MGKTRKKQVLGMDCYTEDGLLWSWTLDDVTYRWCKIGFCEMVYADGRIKRVMHSKTLEGAVGYTCGYHDASRLAQRGNMGSIPAPEE